MKTQKGFTLIELLAVIVILGIVVAIAIPGINAVINNSRQKSVDSEANLIQSAAINKLAIEPNFDFNIINKNNLKEHLETDGSKYDSVSIVKNGNKIIVTLKKYGLSATTIEEITSINVELYYEKNHGGGLSTTTVYNISDINDFTPPGKPSDAVSCSSYWAVIHKENVTVGQYDFIYNNQDVLKRIYLNDGNNNLTGLNLIKPIVFIYEDGLC